MFLAPWFLGLTTIVFIPILGSLYLSFTNYDFLQSPTWVGLENYITMFTSDPRFISAAKVTAIYVGLSVPLQLAFALLLAVVLNQGLKALAIYRSIFYLPSLLGSSAAIAILWVQVFGMHGMVNWVLQLVHVPNISWISDPRFALYTLVALNVWQFGAPMIIFLAGLRQIPQMYYESAAVDGAGRFSQFIHITLPLLTPVVLFNLILQGIGAFHAFTAAYIVSGGTGGPLDSTLFYTLYLYLQGFGNFKMGYASAMAWILLVVIAIFTALNFLISRYWVFYGDQ